MPLPLVGFVRRRNDAASQRGFTQFHFDPLGFFLHSNPAKLADEMKNFHRPAFIVLRGGNFSTLQVKVHGFSPSMETIAIVRAIFAIARGSHLGSLRARKSLSACAGARPIVRQKSRAGVHELLPHWTSTVARLQRVHPAHRSTTPDRPEGRGEFGFTLLNFATVSSRHISEFWSF
jgi:hypothetical protein